MFLSVRRVAAMEQDTEKFTAKMIKHLSACLLTCAIKMKFQKWKKSALIPSVIRLIMMWTLLKAMDTMSTNPAVTYR